LVHGMVAWLVRAWWVGVLVRFGMRLVVGAWYMVAWLVRAWWVGVLVWFGIRLVVGAWYGGMAGKSLVGGCVGMVWHEACGWCMV
jgi:hypothetical protein